MKLSLYGASPLCSLVIYKRTSLWKPFITLMTIKWLLPTVYYLMICKTDFKRNCFIILITFKWFPLLCIFWWLIKLIVNAKHWLTKNGVRMGGAQSSKIEWYDIWTIANTLEWLSTSNVSCGVISCIWNILCTMKIVYKIPIVIIGSCKKIINESFNKKNTNKQSKILKIWFQIWNRHKNLLTKSIDSPTPYYLFFIRNGKSALWCV